MNQEINIMSGLLIKELCKILQICHFDVAIDVKTIIVSHV